MALVPIRVLLCVDSSASAARTHACGRPHLQLLKDAVIAALSGLPKGSEACLVTYDTLSHIVFPPQPITPAMAAPIGRIRHGSCANLELGLRTLLSQHVRHPTTLRTVCVVVAAGAPHKGISDAEALADAVKAIKLWDMVTYSVVDTSPKSQEMLQALSSRLYKGQYTHVADAGIVSGLQSIIQIALIRRRLQRQDKL